MHGVLVESVDKINYGKAHLAEFRDYTVVQYPT